MMATQLLVLLGATFVSMVSSQGPFSYLPTPPGPGLSFARPPGPMLASLNGMGMPPIMRNTGPLPPPGMRNTLPQLLPPSRSRGPIPGPGPYPSSGPMRNTGPLSSSGFMRNAGPVPPSSAMRNVGPVPPPSAMRNTGPFTPSVIERNSSPLRNSGQVTRSMRNRATRFNSVVPNIASHTNSGTRAATSGGFSLGFTEDGQEGYYGPSGGNQGFPYLGGAGKDEQYSDGGVMAGVANGYGAGSYMAFLEKQRLGIDDPFPFLVGPQYDEVWSRYVSSLPNGASIIPPSGLNRVSGSSNGMATARSPRRNTAASSMTPSVAGPTYMIPAGPPVMMSSVMRMPSFF